MDLIDRAIRAKRESKYIEFKGWFDPIPAGEWCEILKDIVAISNSGGGVIVFGLDSHGDPTGYDVGPLLSLDPSVMIDKIHRYTDQYFSGFDLSEHEKGGVKIAILQIELSNVPMVFVRPGTYLIEGSTQQKTAFSQGTVYFRHGAKSEPGNSEDLRKVIEANLETIRREWLDGVRRVVTAPRGANLTILPREIRESTSSDAVPIRVVDDSSAPVFRIVNPDETHPHRQKELMERVNERLPVGTSINSHDVLVVRKLHQLDSTRAFIYRPKFGVRQYSDECVSWFIDRYLADNQFFKKERTRFAIATYSSASSK